MIRSVTADRVSNQVMSPFDWPPWHPIFHLNLKRLNWFWIKTYPLRHRVISQEFVGGPKGRKRESNQRVEDELGILPTCIWTPSLCEDQKTNEATTFSFNWHLAWETDRKKFFKNLAKNLAKRLCWPTYLGPVNLINFRHLFLHHERIISKNTFL